MKTKLLLVAVIAALALIPSVSMAQVKGATLLKKLQTTEDLQQVDAGDSIVMSCPKCKDTYVTVVTKSTRGMQPDEIKNVVKHLCPTCSTRIKTEGVGHNAVNKLVHSCNKCGSDDVSCCLMKKDGGSTRGMEDKK